MKHKVYSKLQKDVCDNCDEPMCIDCGDLKDSDDEAGPRTCFTCLNNKTEPSMI